jgi:serine O-acetyltransferase
MHHDCRKGYQVGLGTSEPSWQGKAKAWLWQLELPCVAVYRLGQLARALRRRNQLLGMALLLVYAPLQFLVRVLLQVDISPRCVIGPGLHLGHPYTIIIGPTTIGANCSLTHNVTIGMGLSAERRGIPTLGDDVWIGPNAVLTGPIHIGDGATVAAGSVVSRDVPPGALVMGNPARIVLASYDNSALLDYEVR